MSGTYYRRGENWSCCPVCGNEYRASAFRKRWDGLWVCFEDYEERHPQDLLRVTPDDMRPAVVAGPQDVIDLLPDIPECVTGLQVEQDDGDLNVSWDAVGNATSYDVRIFPENDPISEPVSVEVASYTVSGLKIGSYTVMVNARNASGVGSAGIATSGQGRPGCSTTPATVEAYTVVDIYDTPGEYEWTIDPLATSVEVRVLGAGGGGGGGVGGSGTANIVTGGGGGGGGAGAVQTYLPSQISGPITITIGSGGDGGLGGSSQANGADGEAGELSRFGDLLAAGGGGGGSGGDWSGAPNHVGGGGGGGVQEGPGDPSANGGSGSIQAGGTAGSVGGASGGTDDESGQIAVDAPSPTTDYGGGGGGAGDFNGSHGSVSLWGAPGGGGGSAAFNGAPSSEQSGASGTASTGATTTPAGGSPRGAGANGIDPTDPLLLAGSSGGGGGGGVGGSGLGPSNGGNGGNGGRGAGGGGGGGIYVGDLPQYHGGDGGRGGDGYVVIIQTFE